MTFTDPSFWWLAAVTFAIWFVLRGRYWVVLGSLAIASLVYYGHDHWWLVFLILSYCIVNWSVALWTFRSKSPRLATAIGVSFNLIVLAFWKYTPLLLTTLAGLAGQTGITLSLPSTRDWAIPAGISFYAFTGIAYMVDVYRKTMPPETNLLRYCLYITFFPHLVAGPILRPNEFLHQLQPGRLPVRPDNALEAMWLIAWGLFKKMVVADRIALSIDPFFAHVGDSTTDGVWSLPFVYLYAFQIYLDFSGYTDIARGIALLFGFRWPDNFNCPYLAVSIQDFWRRWHITLSRFLKDYLYISLGGNRKGRWRTQANMMITMLLGGLWHGASWSFLLWGAIHGTLLCSHRIWSETRIASWLNSRGAILRSVWSAVSVALTFHAVCLAWCFFRITDYRASLTCIRKWFDFDASQPIVGGAADLSVWMLLAGYLVLSLLLHKLPMLQANDARRPAQSIRDPRAAGIPDPVFTRGLQWGLCFASLVLVFVLSPDVDAPPFIYFQF